MEDLITNAETAIRRAGLTVDDFCNQIGVHRATWQRWKAGKTSPRLSDWQRIEDALHSLKAA